MLKIPCLNRYIATDMCTVARPTGMVGGIASITNLDRHHYRRIDGALEVSHALVLGSRRPLQGKHDSNKQFARSGTNSH